MKAPIAVALDAPNLETVKKWALAAAPAVDVLKVGLEVFLRDGAAAIEVIKQTDCKLFLDLKLHDIPNTVKGASQSVARFSPDFLTVHASGGPAMIAAAANALPETRITAVTVLTSMSSEDLKAIGFEKSAEELAVRLAKMAVENGARAIVCSPHEVAAIRSVVSSDIVLITPGVRPVGADVGDQSRVATPQEAIANGANIVVIGRPITGALDIQKAAMEIAASL
ncbi:MAG: orotidine-5'-phosphate decarboxylase [Actinobacteria bacterium]|nr:orotidine-5'-phosphate decarboxylase [Actinomycetota bacterium]